MKVAPHAETSTVSVSKLVQLSHFLLMLIFLHIATVGALHYIVLYL